MCPKPLVKKLGLKPPAIPTQAPSPVTENNSSGQVKKAVDRALQKSGFSSRKKNRTLLTSPLGDTSNVITSIKQILGG